MLNMAPDLHDHHPKPNPKPIGFTPESLKGWSAVALSIKPSVGLVSDSCRVEGFRLLGPIPLFQHCQLQVSGSQERLVLTRVSENRGP